MTERMQTMMASVMTTILALMLTETDWVQASTATAPAIGHKQILTTPTLTAALISITTAVTTAAREVSM
jgi:hypothetical protein